MVPPFQEERLAFECFSIESPPSIPKAQVNGWGVLCTWPEEGYIGHSTLLF